MSESLDYNLIYKQNGKEFFGLKTMFFKKENANKLIVVFSAMNQMSEFDRVKTFYNNKLFDSYNIVFLQDKQYSYYLGNDNKPLFHSYRKIIEYYMGESNVGVDQTISFGSSMGGYAAILFAFKMGLKGAITGVPQVNKKFARMHSLANWTKSINSTGSLWEELDELLYQTAMPLPSIYLEYGPYAADEFSADAISSVYSYRNGFIMKNKGICPDHKFFVHQDIIFPIAEVLINSPKSIEPK